VKIDRIDEVAARLGERFAARILTPEEREEYQQSAQSNRLLAKRFAAKEAVAKALGTGIGRGVSWQDIRIDHDANGAPLVRLSGGASRVAAQRGGTRVEISLADEREYVVAFAVLAA
jgi:holo-[acyl-carrier protein] synthase